MSQPTTRTEIKLSRSDWQKVRLSDVLHQQKREVAVEATDEYSLLGAHWYAKGLYVKEVKSGSQIKASKLYRVEQGDFVYNRLFAWKGSFAVAEETADGCYVSNEFPTFTVEPDRVDARYLWWYFSRQSAWDQALGVSYGATPTSRNRLKERDLLAMEIPLPPLEEQRRIVAKIEHLAAKIDKAHGLRRQSMQLSYALPHRAAAFVNDLEALTMPLGTLLREKSRNGLSARPSDEPVGHRILRISAGTSRSDAVVDENDYKYLDATKLELQDYTLEPGDLLACRFNGNLHYVGRFSLYVGESGRAHLHPDKLIRFRVDTTRVTPKYIRTVMNSPYGRDRIEGFCKTTAGNIGISAKNLNSIPVPVPDKAQQHRIVTYLEGLQAKVDRLKALQEKTATELDALLPSILDKAFKGEL